MTAQLLFPLLLVALLVPMFLGVRRQKREAAKVDNVQQGIKVGDRVITTSGLYGTVVDVDDTTVDLEIAEDVVTTWLRAAIRDIRTDDANRTDAVGTAHSDDEPAEDEHAAGEPTESTSLDHPVNGVDAVNGSGSEPAASNGSASHDAAAPDQADDTTRLRKD